MAFNTFPTSSPWPPLELANDLNDNFSKTVEVSLSTNPVDGAVLVYDASADIWTDGQETVSIDDLTNVVLDTAPTDGDVLTYDASSDTWINSPAVTYSLGELDDVVLPTTPADGDALIYDASSDTWITGSGGVTTLEALTDVVLSTNPNDGSALVYDASSDTWIDGEAAGGDPTINSQTGTSYTLVIGDAYNTVSMDNASANTLTIPTNASVAFDTGTVIAVLQEGAGTTTISGDTGVTVNGTSGGSEDIGTQYASAALVKVGTDEWVVAVGSGSGGGGSSTLTGLSDTAISTTPNDGDVLTYDASSDTWVDAAAASPAIEHIETQTASSSAQLDFTGFDSTKYVAYKFVFENLVPSSDGTYFDLLLSNDGGSSFIDSAGSYAWSTWYWSTSGSTFQGGNNSSDKLRLVNPGNASGEYFSGSIELLSPHESSFYTHVNGQFSTRTNTGLYYGVSYAGERKTTEDNDALRIKTAAGNITSGKVRMYGIRG